MSMLESTRRFHPPWFACGSSLPDETAARLGCLGAVVLEVTPGSAAAKAGVPSVALYVAMPCVLSYVECLMAVIHRAG